MTTLPVTTLLLYLLKLSLIAGCLYGYYHLFLRNRLFHQYNRFYLLGIAVVSLVLPLVPMPSVYPLPPMTHHPVLSGALHAITPGDWKETAPMPGRSGPGQEWPGWQGLVLGIYLMVSGVFLCTLLRQLRYIGRLLRKYPGEMVGDVTLLLTNEPGTPFSFLDTLFWNEEIDLRSAAGQQVFRHELYHIRQKHTLDLLLMKGVMILFWPIPFFHLIYRELRTIHEFLADRHAVSGSDPYQYAELLVWHAVHDRPSSLLHPFFQSSIKRRITMITQLKSTTPGYISRAMALPVLLLLMSAFASRLSSGPAGPTGSAVVKVPLASAAASPKPFTVVIDAGHGGIDDGAVTKTGVIEKGINLALALKVKQLSAEYKVKVLLTREDDELAGGKKTLRQSLEYRTQMANASHADLFISLHTDVAAGENGQGGHGFSIYVSSDNQHYPQSVQLGSDLAETLKASYPTDQDLKQSKQGVWVLRESAMPAVLILCGNISNPEDLAFISDEQNQEKIARDILQGIQKYEEAQTSK
jgi:N-acetylmuramoyl-L-alanine amidase